MRLLLVNGSASMSIGTFILAALLPLSGCTAEFAEDDDLGGDDAVGEAAQALAGDNVWNKRVGGPGDQIASDIATDSAGSVVLVGSLRGTLTLGGTTLTSVGGADVLVIKIDKGGTPLWVQRFGGPGDDHASLVATDPQDNAVLQVQTEGPVDFGGGAPGLTGVGLVKLSPGGAHVWTRNLQVPAVDLATAPTGHILLAGTFMGDLDLGAGPLVSSASGPDGFVARLDAAGTTLWTQAFGGEGEQQALAVAADGAGNVLVGGFHGPELAFGGTLSTDTGSSNAFLAKLSPAGAPLWTHRPNQGPEQGAIQAVAVDHLGNVIATGFDRPIGVSGRSLSLHKLTGSGAPLWRRAFAGTPAQPSGNPGTWRGRHLAVDPSDNLVVVTSNYVIGLDATIDLGGGPLPSGILVARFDPSGNHAWSKSWELWGPASLAVRANGSVFVGGAFQNATLDVGGWPMTNQGGADLFLTNLAP